MSIDFTKPLQTSDGRKVRLLCTDAHEPYPVVCLCEDTKLFALFTLDGKQPPGGHIYLMNVPKEVTVKRFVDVLNNADKCPTEHELAEAALVARDELNRLVEQRDAALKLAESYIAAEGHYGEAILMRTIGEKFRAIFAPKEGK